LLEKLDTFYTIYFGMSQLRIKNGVRPAPYHYPQDFRAFSALRRGYLDPGWRCKERENQRGHPLAELRSIEKITPLRNIFNFA